MKLSLLNYSWYRKRSHGIISLRAVDSSGKMRVSLYWFKISVTWFHFLLLSYLNLVRNTSIAVSEFCSISSIANEKSCFILQCDFSLLTPSDVPISSWSLNCQILNVIIKITVWQSERRMRISSWRKIYIACWGFLTWPRYSIKSLLHGSKPP